MRIEGFQGGFLPLSGGALTGALTINGKPVKALKAEVAGNNAGLVTVTNAGVAIVGLNIGAVAVGDRVEIWANVAGTKGATAGSTILEIVDNGSTAVFNQQSSGQTPQNQEQSTPIAANAFLTLVVALEVTGAGNLNLNMSGISNGSNLSVPAANGRAVAKVYSNI